MTTQSARTSGLRSAWLARISAVQQRMGASALMVASPVSMPT